MLVKLLLGDGISWCREAHDRGGFRLCGRREFVPSLVSRRASARSARRKGRECQGYETREGKRAPLRPVLRTLAYWSPSTGGRSTRKSKKPDGGIRPARTLSFSLGEQNTYWETPFDGRLMGEGTSPRGQPQAGRKIVASLNEEMV